MRCFANRPWCLPSWTRSGWAPAVLLASLLLACNAVETSEKPEASWEAACARRSERSDARGAAGGAEVEQRARPSVLVVVLDTTRADRTTVATPSLDTTPTLAGLAETSLVFRDAASSGSWTLPAHASLFTGLYAYQHGVHWLQDQSGERELGGFAPALRDEERVLAEVFRDAGYCTLGVSPNYWLTESMGFAQGFDRWQVFAMQKNRSGKHYVPGERVVDALLEDLEPVLQLPFFAFVNLMDAHAPYQPEAGADRFSRDVYTRFSPATHTGPDGAPHPPRFWDGSIYSNGLRRLVNLDGVLPDPGVQQYVQALYEDELHYADAQLGRIVEFLRTRERLDDTILVVVGDHGESFFVHGLVNHGIGVYEETLHVPLLIRYPGRVAPGLVDERVEIIDVFPTLLALADVADPGTDGATAHRFGVDLTDAEARHAARASLAENYRNPWERETARPELLRTTRAIVLDGWKRIEVSDGPGQPELYDLRSDPEEQTNLAGTPRAAEAPALLQSELERLSSGGAAPSAAPAEMSADEIEQLRALGYVEGD